MKRVLITGGTGFAGSHLLEHLKRIKDDLEIHLTHFGQNLPDFVSEIPKHCLHQIDLRERSAVEKLIKTIKPDQVYHLAALASVGSSFGQATSVIANNINIQIYLLEAIAALGSHCRVLVVGSAEEYGLSEAGELPISEDHPFRPTSPYAVSKIAQDMLAYSYTKTHSLDIVRVRPFNHTGERQTVDFAIPSFASQIVAIERGEQKKLLVGNLSAKRDLSDVKDVVAAYEVIMRLGKTGEVYNIGSGESVSMQQILDELCSLSQSRIIVEEDSSKVRPVDIPDMRADYTKLQALGWQTTIERVKTLERVLHWWRLQPEIQRRK